MSNITMDSTPNNNNDVVEHEQVSDQAKQQPQDDENERIQLVKQGDIGCAE